VGALTGRRWAAYARRWQAKYRQVALIEEFRSALGETPHTWVEWSSSQLLQNTPFHPIAEWGRQQFGADLPTEQRLADLENTLRLVAWVLAGARSQPVTLAFEDLQ
jgi:hypothetical protein